MPSIRIPSFRPLSRSRSRMSSYDSDNEPSPSSSTSSINDDGSSSSSRSRSKPSNPSHNSIWYHPDQTVSLSLPRRTRRLFEDYSKIPKDEVESHVLSVREKAWDVHSYASIGSFRFLDGSVHWTPEFETILARLKAKPSSLRSRSRSRSTSPISAPTSRPSSSHLLSRPPSSHLLSLPSTSSSKPTGARLLDLGCCLGQDLRFFAYRGAPPQNLYGIDVYPDFITLGYDLFNDSQKIPPSNFFVGDVFNPDDLRGGVLDHGMDIIHIGSFLHMFSWDQQIAACERIVGFLKEEEGVTVFGRQLGSTNPGVYMGRDKCGAKNPYKEEDDVSERWRHDDKSFERMWADVGMRTATSWHVEVDMKDFQKENGKSYGDPNLRRLLFKVTRIA